MKKTLCLGDSYTIGEGVLAEQSWPGQLVQQLKNDNIIIERCDVIATTGWTTNDLIQAIDRFVPDTDYDFVFLSIGVNNQYQGLDIQLYQNELTFLLNNAIRFANNDPAHVFVISIPGYEKTSYAKNADNLLQRKAKYPQVQDTSAEEIGLSIDRYNALAKHIITEMNANHPRHITFIDITPVSREKANLTTTDGLHPSAQMYHEWINLIFPHIKIVATAKSGAHD